MKRREFSAAAAGLAAAGALGLPGAARAQRLPREGADYRTLERPAPLDAPAGRIEVIEFFWYSCPHCNAFEPRIVGWTKRQQPDVVFKRVPVNFRDPFVPQQRLFYVLEAMGRLDDLHSKVFEAIHQRQEPTAREGEILAFAQQHGLDRAKFQELYNSFTVASKARRATQLQEAYRVESVPSMGVAGRFYTDGDLAGTHDRMLQVVDYLVAEARKAK